jgi:hypothetical protein
MVWRRESGAIVGFIGTLLAFPDRLPGPPGVGAGVASFSECLRFDMATGSGMGSATSCGSGHENGT